MIPIGVLVPYLVEYLKPYRAPEDFTTKHGYIGYLNGADIISVRGEQVRRHDVVNALHHAEVVRHRRLVEPARELGAHHLWPLVFTF